MADVVSYVKKGQKISCGKNVICASVALNWSSPEYKGAYDLELDVSAFLLYKNGKVKNEEDFIFYNNPKSKDGSIEMISTQNGKAEINIDFNKIANDVSKIAITLTIFDSFNRKQNFGHISSLIAQLTISGQSPASYIIDKKDFKIETAIVVCEIYRYKDDWKFAAIGAGYQNGLNALCSSYGIKTTEEYSSDAAKVSMKSEKNKTKPKPPLILKKELFDYLDSILKIWNATDLMLRQNNTFAKDMLDDDPEIFDTIVFASMIYLGENVNVERGLKSEIIKKILSRSRKFTGLETIDKISLQQLLDSSFDKLNFVDVVIGSKKTDATCLYCIIISAIGLLLLRAITNITEEDVAVYEDIVDIIGNYNKIGALDILDTRCDITYINQLDDWYVKYVVSGALFQEESQSLEELLEELNSLTGLKEVKSDVNSLINMVRIQQVRKERNLSVTPMSLHLVFSGNPGTGKTTVARLIAKIYKAMGLLKKGHLIEVDRSKLVAGYVGQTAIKVSEAVESAIGGVLFIDEAYALTFNKGGQDFGQEAVDTLLKAMEDRRGEFIVIAAGYNAEMQQFIFSNPGLQSRFNKYIYFEDYESRELLSIFKGMCLKSGMIISRDAEKYVSSFFAERYNNRSKNYANAREVRNFYEKMLITQANRLSEKDDWTNEDLSYIRFEDVAEVQL